MQILDEGLSRQRTPEEESEYQLLRMDADTAIKGIRNGQFALFGIIVIQLISTFRYFAKGSLPLVDAETSTIVGAGSLLFALVFGILAIFCKKYPVVCFSVALVFYVLIILVNALGNASSLYQGIILKLVLLYAWGNALNAGFKMKKLVRLVGEMGVTEKELREGL